MNGLNVKTALRAGTACDYDTVNEIMACEVGHELKDKGRPLDECKVIFTDSNLVTICQEHYLTRDAM